MRARVAILGTGRMGSALARRLEMSTSGPGLLAELEPQLAATGSTLVDAPVVGAPTAVLRGGAAILVGGAPADVEHVRPVLGLLGEVRHVGALGSGARLKLVANSMLGTVTMAAAELPQQRVPGGECCVMNGTPLGAVVTSAGSEIDRTTVRLSPTTMVARVYVATAPSWDS